MTSQFPSARTAAVQRHHRLAVLLAQGYTEEWLAADGRDKHVVSRWLEHGWSDPADPALLLNGSQSFYDKLAQQMANMEALGRGEASAYREGLHRIVDRLDRLIVQEFGVETKPEPLPSGGGLVGAINDVFAFHDATDVPCLNSPQWPGDERAQLRWNMTCEELGELGDALGCNHDRVREVVQKLQALQVQPFKSELGSKSQLIDVADALADKIYIDVGTALEFGIPLDRVWSEVQRANMAKVGPDGKVMRRADGKILKPEGWSPPDVEKAVFGGGR